jgi:hypothetical protein
MTTQISQHSRSPSPRSLPRLEKPCLASAVYASDDFAFEDSKNTLPRSTNCQHGKDPTSPSIDLKGIRSYSDVFTTDDVQEIGGEQPKVAIKRGLRGNWPKLAPHILAVLVTISICQLSFRNVYWMDLQPPNELVVFSLTQSGVLNCLQLAAKLHELLILASISTIVLHTVQTYITGRSGLPIGMISNAFELGSAQFLRRKSFWAFLWSVDPITNKRFTYIYFWLLSLFSTLLITMAGPSSAIAIIPRLDYFDLQTPFVKPVLPYYVWNVSTELWPANLTAASLNAPNSGNLCNVANDLTDRVCPDAGFEEIYNWSVMTLFDDIDTGTNLSFPDNSGATQRIVRVQSCNSTLDGRASAVSLNTFISGALTAYVSIFTPLSRLPLNRFVICCLSSLQS